MDRYHIIKRLRKLLNRLSLYLQGTIMTETQIRNIVHEIEALVRIAEESGKKVIIPHNTISRIKFFIESFKHLTGIEKSHDKDVMGIEHLKDFLSEELGIKVNKDYMFHANRNGIPLHLLLI